jgi:hypothetical protein
MDTFRRPNVDPLVCGFVVLAGFCCGRGDAAEVSVLEPVAVSFQGDDVGVVDEAVDHGGGDGVVAEYLAPANRGCHMFPMAYLIFHLRLCGSGVAG